MSTSEYLRETDQAVADGRRSGPLDLAPVEGEWVSASEVTGGVAWLRTRACDGTLLVSASGASDGPRPGAWEEVPADLVVAREPGSFAAYAFCVAFEGGPAAVRLQTYQGLGVLVVHAFHRFTDGSGRCDYFTREFYVPAEGPLAAGGARPPRDLPARYDAAGLLGVWTVLDPAPEGVAMLQCSPHSHGIAIRAHGTGEAGPVDWGTAEVRLYADAANPQGPPAFLVTFDRPSTRVHLQARVNRGVLVVGEYIEPPRAGGEVGHFARECYRRR
jgi:hypothetical protein